MTLEVGIPQALYSSSGALQVWHYFSSHAGPRKVDPCLLFQGCCAEKYAYRERHYGAPRGGGGKFPGSVNDAHFIAIKFFLLFRFLPPFSSFPLTKPPPFTPHLPPLPPSPPPPPVRLPSVSLRPSVPSPLQFGPLLCRKTERVPPSDSTKPLGFLSSFLPPMPSRHPRVAKDSSLAHRLSRSSSSPPLLPPLLLPTSAGLAPAALS